MTDKAAGQLYRNARREAVQIVCVVLLALTWTVGYCYLRGYDHASDSWVVQKGWAAPAGVSELGRSIAGMPDWVFLGILLPWLLCTAFTIGFGLGMKDDDLGIEAGEEVEHGH